MTEKLSKNDVGIIVNLAEYRVMTVRQMEVLYPGNSRVLRGKLKKFAGQDLICIDSSPFAGKKGRPSDVFSIGKAGFKLLRSRQILSGDIPFERVMAITAHSRAHMLAINNFRIQLVQTEKIVPDLSVTFLSPNSPFIQFFDDGRSIVNERFALDKAGEKWIRYTPDGVFVMRCTRSKKTILFFLEVDMATETLSSGKGYKGCIEEKIINYQLTYKLGRYKRYGSIFKSRLQGFRLLFVTSDLTRLSKLAKLTAEMPPSDFVNITDQQRLSSRGLWSSIWHKGGRVDLRPVSILGSKSPKHSPAPDEIS